MDKKDRDAVIAGMLAGAAVGCLALLVMVMLTETIINIGG